MNDKWKHVRRYGSIVLVHVGCIVIWQIQITVSNIPDYVMPTPAAALLSLSEDYGWLHNTYATALEVFDDDLRLSR
jgi:NitT/TauT family transport system permease protein